MRVCGPDHVLHSSDAAGARASEPPVARAVFVTPAGDRAAARAAVVAAGGSRRAGSADDSRPPSAAGELAAVRRSPAIAGAEIAETSSPDAIVTQGVVLTGADGLQRAGATGRASRSPCSTRPSAPEQAGRARGHGAAAARPPAPADVRSDLRAGRARLQRQHVAPRRVRDRDRLRHGARRDLLVPQLPHARRVRPGRRLHRERAPAGHRDPLELVPVRAVRRLRLVRAQGGRGGRGGRALGQLGGQLPQPALGGPVERRRRRRQPRRDRRRQRVRLPAGGDQPPGLRPLVGGGRPPTRTATTASRSSRDAALRRPRCTRPPGCRSSPAD